MKGFRFSSLKTILFVICFLSVLLPGMGGPTEGADPLEARGGDKGLTDAEKKDAGITYDEYGQVVGQKETTTSKDKGSKDKEKGGEGRVDAYEYTDTEGTVHHVDNIVYNKDGEVVSYQEDEGIIKAEKGKDSVTKGKPPEKGVKPGDSKDLEDVLKGTKKAEKKLKPPLPPKDEAVMEDIYGVSPMAEPDYEKGILKKKEDILYDEFGEEIGQKEVEISKDKGPKDKEKEGGGIIYDEYGKKVGYQETGTSKDKESVYWVGEDEEDMKHDAPGLVKSYPAETRDSGVYEKKKAAEIYTIDQLEVQRRTGKEIRRIGMLVGQGKPLSEIQDAWEGFVKGADAGAIMPAINGVLQEAIQEALKNAQHSGDTDDDKWLPEPNEDYSEPMEEWPDPMEEWPEPMEIEEEYEAVAIADVAKMLYDTVVANRGKDLPPGDSKDLEDVLKGTKKAQKKPKLPSPPKDEADSKEKFLMDKMEEMDKADKRKESPKLPSPPKDKGLKDTVIEDVEYDVYGRVVHLETLKDEEKKDAEIYTIDQLEKQKRTGKEIRRIGKMIGQGRPISEIQGAWTAFIKGADAKAIMPAINGVLLEAVQEALKNAQHSGDTWVPELEDITEPMDMELEPPEPFEKEEVYEAVAISIADITKMLYDTVVATRGKDLPSDWYHVEAETSLELPKITAPSLDIDKQKLPTIKPPKVIKMPKTVERPRPVEMPRPPAAEKPPTAKGPEGPSRPEAGDTSRPSGGRR